MDKNDAKKALENYVFDMQYYLEKCKERESVKDRVQQSILRVKLLEEHSACEVGEMRSSLERIIAIEKKEEDALIQILIKKQRIEDVISKLNSVDRTILYMRYMQAYTFDQIAYKLNYSTKRIYQLHAIALENFAVLYVEEMRKSGEN